jgi:hypothetical protein
MPEPLRWNTPGLKWNTPGLKWNGFMPEPKPPHIMSSDNRISAELAAEAKAQILTKLREIKALLPFLVTLTPKERKGTPTIGTERTGMVVAFTASMNAHPEFIPGFVEMPEVTLDRDLREAMLEVFMATTELQEAQADTLQVIGRDLYMAFMSYYANVQQAAKRGVPGAETVLNDLKRFIPRGRSSGPETPPAQ